MGKLVKPTDFRKMSALVGNSKVESDEFGEPCKMAIPSEAQIDLFGNV